MIVILLNGILLIVILISIILQNVISLTAIMTNALVPFLCWNGLHLFVKLFLANFGKKKINFWHIYRKKCLAVLAKKVFGQLWQKTYLGNFGKKKAFGQLWQNTLWDKFEGKNIFWATLMRKSFGSTLVKLNIFGHLWQKIGQIWWKKLFSVNFGEIKHFWTSLAKKWANLVKKIVFCQLWWN